MNQAQNIEEIVKSKALSAEEALELSDSLNQLCNLCDTQKKLTKLNDLFYNLSDGIIIFDLDLKAVEANKKGESFLNENQKFSFDNRNYLLKELPFFKEAQTNSKITSINKRSEHKVFNVSTSFIYSEKSTVMGICMVINDITEVEKQVWQMEDMMSSFTHDLKTPLLALETNIEHILEGEYGKLNAELKNILELMLNSSSNTVRLVKNLLTIFKYDTKSYKLLLKDIKAREIINNTIRSIDHLINGKKIKIITELESNYSVYCDPFEIERVLTNLLTNAIKFSDKENEIKISVSDNANFLIFSVSDKGIGIPKEQISSLFSRFWQSKVYDSKTNGTGLGLYLSRQIVEAHGGKIWAESEEGKGTVIKFKIPKTDNHKNNEEVINSSR